MFLPVKSSTAAKSSFVTVRRAGRQTESPYFYYWLKKHPGLLSGEAMTDPAQGLTLNYCSTQKPVAREVVYVERAGVSGLADLFQEAGFIFEDEHLSFDCYLSERQSVPVHLSVRYHQAPDQHLVVRVDFEETDQGLVQRPTIFIKQYQTGQFHLATPYSVSQEHKLGAVILRRIKQYAQDHYERFLAHHRQEKQAMVLQLKEQFDTLSEKFSMPLHEPDSQALNEKIRSGGVLLQHMVELNQMDPENYRSDLCVRTQLVSYQEQLHVLQHSDPVTQSTFADYDDSDEVVQQHDVKQSETKIAPSKVQQTIAETMRLKDRVLALNARIEKMDFSVYPELMRTVERIETLLLVLDLSESDAEKEGIGEARRDTLKTISQQLAGYQQVLRAYESSPTDLCDQDSVKHRYFYDTTVAKATFYLQNLESGTESENKKNKVRFFSFILAMLVDGVTDEKSAVDNLSLAYVGKMLVGDDSIQFDVLQQLGAMLSQECIGYVYTETENIILSTVSPSIDDPDCFKDDRENLAVIPKQHLLMFYQKKRENDLPYLCELNGYLEGFKASLLSSLSKFTVIDLCSRLLRQLLDAKKPEEALHSVGNCLAYLWLFNIATGVAAGIHVREDYLGVIRVMTDLQCHQKGLTPHDFFDVFNKCVLVKCSAQDQGEIKSSEEYTTLLTTVLAQTRAEKQLPCLPKEIPAGLLQKLGVMRIGNPERTKNSAEHSFSTK